MRCLVRPPQGKGTYEPLSVVGPFDVDMRSFWICPRLPAVWCLYHAVLNRLIQFRDLSKVSEKRASWQAITITVETYKCLCNIVSFSVSSVIWLVLNSTSAAI